MFPLTETDFPSGKFKFPSAENKFPVRKFMFPVAETYFPVGKFKFPLAENKFPSSKLTILFAEIKFCDHSKIRTRTKNTYKKMQWVKSKSQFLHNKKRLRVKF